MRNGVTQFGQFARRAQGAGRVNDFSTSDFSTPAAGRVLVSYAGRLETDLKHDRSAPQVPMTGLGAIVAASRSM